MFFKPFIVVTSGVTEGLRIFWEQKFLNHVSVQRGFTALSVEEMIPIAVFCRPDEDSSIITVRILLKEEESKNLLLLSEPRIVS